MAASKSIQPLTVSQALQTRRSVRAFLDRPVDAMLLREVLRLASRAPSGGNLQPWRLFVLGGTELECFRASVAERLSTAPQPDPPEYDIYPSPLIEPYRAQRSRIGEKLYGLLGITREQKAQRLRQFANNYRFFGAPTALFCYVDRSLGPPQWSDLGMYLQSVMLLLRERGLDSCAQECWSQYHSVVGRFLGAPDHWMLFCGMAIGYADPVAPINGLESERMPLEEFVTFRGT